jgi:hypothetical protein
MTTTEQIPDAEALYAAATADIPGTLPDEEIDRLVHERTVAERTFMMQAAPALLAEVKRLREHIAFVLNEARERNKDLLYLRDTHKASKRTQTRGHAWEEAAYEVRKIAELLERVDSPA